VTADAAPGAPPVLELRDVAHTYPGPPAFTALHPVTLTVRAGEHIALVGPSGAGKSTLLNVLGLLDTPTEGLVLFEGADTTVMPDAARTTLRGRRIGFVFQAFHLVAYRTALHNVALGLLYAGFPRSQRVERATRALATVGLGDRVTALPTQLSGGERQRVAIARALAVEPALLLCDEPTGNLDSGNTLATLDLLDELNAQGHTVVTVTHSDAVAGRARRVLTLADGRLVQDTGTDDA
jgi:putative ABC transport system ATP-binding protein